MLSTITSFLTDKGLDKELIKNILYVCPGGSHISGTNDENSDLDFRSILLPTEDYLIGLNKFESSKFVSGKNKINQKDDLDVDVYSLHHFMKEAFYGEIVPFEMLHIDNSLVLQNHDLLNPLFENKEIFLSQTVVFKYLSFVKGYEKKMTLPIENLRRKDNIERVEKFGFETKCGMKAIQLLRLNVELLRDNAVNLYRKDKDFLMSIKQGHIPLSDVQKEISELTQEIESLLKTTSLPRKPDFTLVNRFHKDYTKQVYKHLNIL